MQNNVGNGHRPFRGKPCRRETRWANSYSVPLRRSAFQTERRTADRSMPGPYIGAVIRHKVYVVTTYYAGVFRLSWWVYPWQSPARWCEFVPRTRRSPRPVGARDDTVAVTWSIQPAILHALTWFRRIPETYPAIAVPCPRRRWSRCSQSRRWSRPAYPERRRRCRSSPA